MKKTLIMDSTHRSYLFPFTLICGLFFLSAFCTSMIDSMDKHFQNFLHLSKSQSAWVQFAHYLGYFLMALPAGWLTKKYGYKKGIIGGLLMVSLGCFWFIPATKIAAFWAFLVGVCIIAMGLTFIETIANPYATALGDSRYASSRINLAQAFNGLGWPLGPLVGGMFFYSSDGHGGAQAANETLWIPYAGVGVVVLFLCVIFGFVRLPNIRTEEKSLSNAGSTNSISSPMTVQNLLILNVLVFSISIATILVAFCGLFDFSETLIHLIFACFVIIPTLFGSAFVIKKSQRLSLESVWAYPHFSAATTAQFFYVAAQAGTFAFFMNYMTEEIPPIPNFMKSSILIGGESGSVLRDGSLRMTDQGASTLLSYAFGIFILGRFTGAVLLEKYSPSRVLGVYGLISMMLHFLVVAKLGWISFLSLFFSFFFMSVMFPTIFSLGIHGLGEKSKVASAYIVMAIMGGAILPKTMGWIADHSNMSNGFLIPSLCFALISLYGFFWQKLSGCQHPLELHVKMDH